MKLRTLIVSISAVNRAICIAACFLTASAGAGEFSLRYNQTPRLYNLIDQFRQSENDQLLKGTLDGYYGRSESVEASSKVSIDNFFSGRLDTEIALGMRGDAWNPVFPSFEFKQLIAGQISYEPNFAYEFRPGLQLKLQTKVLGGSEKSASRAGTDFIEAVHVPSGWVESFAAEGDLSWIWGSLFSARAKLRPRYSVFQSGIREGQHLSMFYAADFNWGFDTVVGRVRLFTGYSNLEVSGLFNIPLIDELYLGSQAAKDWKRNIYLGVEKGLGRKSWFNTFAGVWGFRGFAGVRAQLGKHFKLLAYYSERSFTAIRNQTVGKQFSLGLGYVW